MNGLLPDTEELVCEYMQAGDANPNIRVIVLTGNGRAFCAGADPRPQGQNQGTETPRRERADGPDSSRENFIHESYPPNTRS